MQSTEQIVLFALIDGIAEIRRSESTSLVEIAVDGIRYGAPRKAGEDWGSIVKAILRARERLAAK